MERRAAARMWVSAMLGLALLTGCSSTSGTTKTAGFTDSRTSAAGSVATGTTAADPSPDSATAPAVSTSTGPAPGPSDPAAGSSTATATGGSVDSGSPAPPAGAATGDLGAGAGVGATVPEITVSAQAPVPLDAASELGSVRARIDGVSDLAVQAIGPGEIGGDGVAVTVTVTNGSTAPVDLAAVAVTLTDSAGQVAIPSTGDPAKPLAGTLAPGASGQGVYVFTVSKEKRDPITVEVTNFAAGASATFVGAVS